MSPARIARRREKGLAAFGAAIEMAYVVGLCGLCCLACAFAWLASG